MEHIQKDINRAAHYNNKMIKISMLCLCISLLISCAAADINLGSISDVRTLTLQKGDIGEFKASFFSLGQNDLELEFSLEYPPELRTEIYPEKMIVHPAGTDTSACEGCQYFILKDGTTYVRTYPVFLYVKIPPQITRNIYALKMTVTAKTKDEPGNSAFKQSLVQVREVEFTAYVPGEVTHSASTGAAGSQENESLAVYDSGTNDNLRQEFISQQNSAAASSQDSGNANAQSTGGQSSANPQTPAETPPTTANTGSLQDPTDLGPVTQQSGNKLIETDSTGKTRINLPTGNVVLSKEQSEATINIGIITLAVSVVTLLAKILKS